MGKGDIKSRRGKITNKSFGKKRPHKLAKPLDTVQEEKTSK
ncbi:SSU ribosomal protein S31P [Arcticibacter tournemirensis]|uniref:30S ribosomal protein THX n=1 Tax=Arcticibacter tournemirensis TaxID=699437 RepID=A0A4Q0MG88_9SPHI|nr:30S ribosomal protein THX [Arcticibacter tournemirensis]KAA8483575.1 30S ribosomal protein THX [Arcticibacter tournemirensis]RXF72571.1 30S ribosomal protein THX [Arcticibacter tournemirensis]TQM51474.1 SSU ribosomal protein S31P [Arcticibacter tournemirensis]